MCVVEQHQNCLKSALPYFVKNGLSLSLWHSCSYSLSLALSPISFLPFQSLSHTHTHSNDDKHTHTHTHTCTIRLSSLSFFLSLSNTPSLSQIHTLSFSISISLSLSLSFSFYPSIFLRARSLTHSCVTRSSVSCVTLGSAATETREPCTLARINTGITGCTK